jgi:hypothetical protein
MVAPVTPVVTVVTVATVGRTATVALVARSMILGFPPLEARVESAVMPRSVLAEQVVPVAP